LGTVSPFASTHECILAIGAIAGGTAPPKQFSAIHPETADQRPPRKRPARRRAKVAALDS
jgi:hypothetical protein